MHWMSDGHGAVDEARRDQQLALGVDQRTGSRVEHVVVADVDERLDERLHLVP